MKIYRHIFLSVVMVLLTLPVTAQVTSEKPWAQIVQGRLDSLMSLPVSETSQVAIMVYDLTADSVVYAANEKQILRPASTMKIITAVTALDVLGGGYMFKTQLGYKGEIKDSVLYGDVYIKGGFDPLFDGRDMHRMGQMLKDAGVKIIDGDVIIDQTMKDTLIYGEGWCWDDDNPVLLPFVYHKDLPEWFPLPITGNTAEISKPEEEETDDKNEEQESALVSDPQMGLEIVDEDTTVMIVLGEVGHGMGEVLEPMMKKSNNYFAESMFYQIGKAVSAVEPATAKMSQRAIGRMIGKMGLKASDYRVADGSGLSLYNYVSAELMIKFLRYAYRKKSIYRHIEPSLPIAGEDGTLKKRMCKTKAAGNVKAKTGTLTGVITLAGYCKAANGHQLAFTIINQGILKGKTARDFQDEVCKAMVN